MESKDNKLLFKRKGRGALSNPQGRFEERSRQWQDDGWHNIPDEKLQTDLIADKSKKVICYNQSPDIPFDRSINPYRGCEHGCIYCFARPSHHYFNLSSGLDFERKIFYKPDAALCLKKELSNKKYSCKTMAIGTNTDPYQPVERQLAITRNVLEVLRDCRHPVVIVTKSALIQRDLDILVDMAKKNLLQVFISITTLDKDLCRSMEPRAASTKRRLEIIELLKSAGVPVGVMLAPIVPGLTDHEIEEILYQSRHAGAQWVNNILLRLPYDVKDLFYQWLQIEYPNKAKKVQQLLRQCHQGRDYNAQTGIRMRGQGVYADLLQERFRLAKDRLGYENTPVNLSTSEFSPPQVYFDKQLSLF